VVGRLDLSARQVDLPVMRPFPADAVRLQLHVLAYNLGDLVGRW
jgi:hypothetical protein